jgi:hypothetical protein
MYQHNPKYIEPSGKKKYGRYSNRYFNGVKGYGTKTWAVWVELEASVKDYDKAESEETFFYDCIEFLNTPPKKKTSKTGKRRKQSVYGLKLNKHIVLSIRRPSESKKTIRFHLLVTTDKKIHKNFWFEGPLGSFGTRRKK